MSTIPLIIGHRGAAHIAPENTIAGFDQAWEEGADGIEADFRLTLDKQIVAMHDATTLRTTGVNLRIAETPLAGLSLLDAGGGSGKWQLRQSIPALDTVLKTLPDGKQLFIELKSDAANIPPLLQLFDETQPPPEQIRILAFNADLLKEIKQSHPVYRTCWRTDFQLTPHWSSRNGILKNILEPLKSSGAGRLGGKAGSMMDAELVGLLRQMGKEIHVWTMDSISAGKRFASLAVDSIITNHPGWLREKLGCRP